MRRLFKSLMMIRVLSRLLRGLRRLFGPSAADANPADIPAAATLTHELHNNTGPTGKIFELSTAV